MPAHIYITCLVIFLSSINKSSQQSAFLAHRDAETQHFCRTPIEKGSVTSIDEHLKEGTYQKESWIGPPVYDYYLKHEFPNDMTYHNLVNWQVYDSDKEKKNHCIVIGGQGVTAVHLAKLDCYTDYYQSDEALLSVSFESINQNNLQTKVHVRNVALSDALDSPLPTENGCECIKTRGYSFVRISLADGTELAALKELQCLLQSDSIDSLLLDIHPLQWLHHTTLQDGANLIADLMSNFTMYFISSPTASCPSTDGLGSEASKGVLFSDDRSSVVIGGAELLDYVQAMASTSSRRRTQYAGTNSGTGSGLDRRSGSSSTGNGNEGCNSFWFHRGKLPYLNASTPEVSFASTYKTDQANKLIQELLQTVKETQQKDHEKETHETALSKAEMFFKEGLLVHHHKDRQVYWIHNKERCPIMSKAGFEKNGWDFDDIKPLDDGEYELLMALPEGHGII